MNFRYIFCYIYVAYGKRAHSDCRLTLSALFKPE